MLRHRTNVGRHHIQRIGPVGLFSPSDIAGLQLWLDANDASTLFQDAAKTTSAGNGDVVGAWADKSGNGKDATQATTAEKPTLQTAIINGLPVVRFDGSDDALAQSLTLSGTQTILMVVKIETLTSLADSVITNKGAGGLTEVAFVDIGGYEEISGIGNLGAGANSVGLDVVLDTNGHTLLFTYNNGLNTDVNSYQIELDGIGTVVTSGLFDRPATDIPSIGARIDNVGAITNSLDGDIGEIIIYDNVISVENIFLLEQYVNRKWGITFS